MSMVGSETSDHSREVSFYTSPFFDYRSHENSPFIQEIERLRSIDQLLGVEDFNHPYSHHIAEMTGSPPVLVLCHNLHGGCFDLRVLSELNLGMPLSLRLFDTWLQIGHWAYSLGCGWQTGCGGCPDLIIPPALSWDALRMNLQRKQRIFQRSRLFVSAETRWMLDRARQSVLAPAVLDWKHIPGGVDLEKRFLRARARRLGCNWTLTLTRLSVCLDGRSGHHSRERTLRQ
jgi:hypothetical protein